MHLVAVLKLGLLPEVGGTSLASSRDPAVLRVLKAQALAEAQARATEAAELGEPTLALVEAERAASLRRLLDQLLPDTTTSVPVAA